MESTSTPSKVSAQSTALLGGPHQWWQQLEVRVTERATGGLSPGGEDVLYLKMMGGKTYGKVPNFMVEKLNFPIKSYLNGHRLSR